MQSCLGCCWDAAGLLADARVCGVNRSGLVVASQATAARSVVRRITRANTGQASGGRTLWLLILGHTGRSVCLGKP